MVQNLMLKNLISSLSERIYELNLSLSWLLELGKNLLVENILIIFSIFLNWHYLLVH